MPHLRITAGTLRGRRINVPPAEVRPTSERARQAFFNIAASRIAGARFLDLFAGSGVFAFEAVSRGASSATAVDLSLRNTAAIARNAKDWDVPVTAVAEDVFRLLVRPQTAFDIVYADPPYEFGRYSELLEAVDASPALASGALVAIEHRKRTNVASESLQRLTLVRRAEYGEVWISLFEAKGKASE